MYTNRMLGVVMMLCMVVGAAAFTACSRTPHKLTAQRAPEFSLDGLDGAEATLAGHAGKEVVVLDFWASWCPPCREGLPVVASIAESYEGKPVAVYAVNVMEDAETAGDYLKSAGLDLAVLMDTDGLVSERYGVTGIPQTVIIDKQGTVAEVHVGYSRGLERSLRQKIDELLAL